MLMKQASPRNLLDSGVNFFRCLASSLKRHKGAAMSRCSPFDAIGTRIENNEDPAWATRKEDWHENMLDSQSSYDICEVSAGVWCESYDGQLCEWVMYLLKNYLLYPLLNERQVDLPFTFLCVWPFELSRIGKAVWDWVSGQYCAWIYDSRSGLTKRPWINTVFSSWPTNWTATIQIVWEDLKLREVADPTSTA